MTNLCTLSKLNVFYVSKLRLSFLSSLYLQKVVGRRLDDGPLLDDAVQRVRRDAHGEGNLLRCPARSALLLARLAWLTGVGGLVGVGGVLGAAVAAAVRRLDVRLLTAKWGRKIMNVKTK